MARHLRMPAALAVYPSFVPGTSGGRSLQPAKGSDTLFWTLQVPTHMWYTFTEMHTHTHKKKPSVVHPFIMKVFTLCADDFYHPKGNYYTTCRNISSF